MIIKTLELTNYRRFRSQAFEFPQNLIGFIGRNGAGKSTVIEAIAWALYGTRATRGVKSDIRSQQASDREACEVVLHFELSGVEYRVMRKLRGKSAVAEAAVWQAGIEEPLAVQEQGVSAFIEELLGLDYRSFFASVFARQKDLAALASMQPEERRKTINRLINIDAVDRARWLAGEKRKQLQAELSGMNAMLKKPEELEEQQRELQQQVDFESKAVASAQKTLDGSLKKLQAAREKLEKLTTIRDKHHQLSAESGKLLAEEAGLQRSLREVKAELTKIGKSEKTLQSMQGVKEKFQQCRERKNALEDLRLKAGRKKELVETLRYYREQRAAENRPIARLEQEIAEYELQASRLAQLETEMKKLEQEQQSVQKALDALRARRAGVESTGKDLRKKFERIRELGKDSPCPVCTRPLAEHYGPVTAHFEQEVRAMREQYKKLSEDVKRGEIRLEELKHALGEKQKEREKLLGALATIEQKRKQLDDARKRIEHYQSKEKGAEAELNELGDFEFDDADYAAVKEEYERLAKMNEHVIQLETQVAVKDEKVQQQQELSKALGLKRDEIETCNKAIADLGHDEKTYEAARELHEARSNVVEEHRQTLTEASKAKIAAETKLQNVERELKELRENMARMESLRDDLLYYQALDEHFKLFRQHLSGRLRPLIAARASELLRLTTSGRYSLLELDEDYGIAIVDQGDTFPLARFSGGEQDLANLCLRIAISQVVAERSGRQPVQCIVLDEVFGSQDAQRQSLILDALNRLQSQFRQIFIISHVEQIKDILPVIYEITMVDEFESRAQVV